ncbi:hypothetical protein K461DRAFT_312075 [Myriangium duriaei CBS 260.36]|uniref:Uncharacterized protein n=1 Tax=Myriangium duriaei CBS 260.36 TaxID=1168546 RepID=A0A9P4J3X4_9PEZI|nr:hypothetical protein K461DRAFT_312075 [Myriangium duriaei CBS 260.36]
MSCVCVLGPPLSEALWAWGSARLPQPTTHRSPHNYGVPARGLGGSCWPGNGPGTDWVPAMPFAGYFRHSRRQSPPSRIIKPWCERVSKAGQWDRTPMGHRAAFLISPDQTGLAPCSRADLDPSCTCARLWPPVCVCPPFSVSELEAALIGARGQQQFTMDIPQHMACSWKGRAKSQFVGRPFRVSRDKEKRPNVAQHVCSRKSRSVVVAGKRATLFSVHGRNKSCADTGGLGIPRAALPTHSVSNSPQ